jgi:hypothetical protein
MYDLLDTDQNSLKCKVLELRSGMKCQNSRLFTEMRMLNIMAIVEFNPPVFPDGLPYNSDYHEKHAKHISGSACLPGFLHVNSPKIWLICATFGQYILIYPRGCKMCSTRKMQCEER